MNYRDLQNISNLSQQILVEGANEEHNVLNRWPYTSPYLQESTEVDEEKKPLPVGKMRDKEKRMMDEPYIPGETAAQLRNHNRRYGNIVDVRRSVSTRGGKRPHPMPEVGRYRPEPEPPEPITSGKTTAQRARKDPKFKEKMIQDRMKTLNNSYDLYDIILEYLITEGYADTEDSALVIMANMSEDWKDSIFEGMKSLPVGKMRDKVNRMRDEPYIPGETAAQVLNHNRRLGNIEDVRRSVSTRGGKMKFPMPEVGRFKSKDD
jgi:hypothetical protein